jgi:signal transduction histidine kinase
VRIWADVQKAEGRTHKAGGRREKAKSASAGSTQPATHSPPPPYPTVRLWFADNGVGIAKEAQGRIFKMFQRLDKSYDGTGVGLTVVAKAVEKMGGKVGVESEPGRGSRFWVELKAVVQPGVSGEV